MERIRQHAKGRRQEEAVEQQRTDPEVAGAFTCQGACAWQRLSACISTWSTWRRSTTGSETLRQREMEHYPEPLRESIGEAVAR